MMPSQNKSAGRDEQDSDLNARLARLERLARLMDDGGRVPRTSVRFGLDALIGLIPGIGDLVGGLISLYVLIEAWRLGAPRRLLMRMLLNILADGILGSVPVLGDLFDVAWKANRRNLRLLTDYLERTRGAAH